MKSKRKEALKKRVLIKTTNSRKVYLFIYLMIIILIGVIIYIKATGRPLNSYAIKLVIGFVIASVIATELHRRYNTYEVDEGSLVHTMGILTKRSRKMDFSAISDLYVIQTLWQRMLSYGSVEVRLFSGENTTHIKNINNPSTFVDIVLSKINREIGGK